MEDKIYEMKKIIIERMYDVLKSGKEMSAETFLGIAKITIELLESEKEHKAHESYECKSDTI